MISKVKILLVAIFLALFCGPLFGQHRLLSDLDIPLMPSFVEEGDSRVVFDTPTGRIIEALATGSSSAKQIQDYYHPVLSSLSWRIMAGKSEKCDNKGSVCMIYQRDGEILTLKIRQEKSPETKTLIYFSVHPE